MIQKSKYSSELFFKDLEFHFKADQSETQSRLKNSNSKQTSILKSETSIQNRQGYFKSSDLSFTANHNI
ncbi:hypothetical protein RclHR1_25890002 [Rhizophagus clarus]|uniref:Uncharacterized protein n=1 Tax=Rhizophagus clarus TaxID=94130 RepID=A0A2Z6R139_9GLOM|nr:hypothetical protein RclHR1_25890002 [Rhizophagus clarus]